MPDCPHCKEPLTDEQVKAIWGSYTQSKRKAPAGGRNGGRPRKDVVQPHSEPSGTQVNNREDRKL